MLFLNVNIILNYTEINRKEMKMYFMYIVCKHISDCRSQSSKKDRKSLRKCRRGFSLQQTAMKVEKLGGR